MDSHVTNAFFVLVPYHNFTLDSRPGRDENIDVPHHIMCQKKKGMLVPLCSSPAAVRIHSGILLCFNLLTATTRAYVHGRRKHTPRTESTPGSIYIYFFQFLKRRAQTSPLEVAPHVVTGPVLPLHRLIQQWSLISLSRTQQGTIHHRRPPRAGESPVWRPPRT